VLWLFEESAVASANLRREARVRGVDASRLVFASRLSLADHLARHAAADLFLDTFPCSAHTTASDALWAGLPLLTLAGESFASRVAASLLHAVDLAELVTTQQDAFESLAVELATNPERLAQIRQKLRAGRLTFPLFDTERLTRHLETAYARMHERCRAGLPPRHFQVEP
jgi:predicted O-linked N-acetylglucosamine transferase (SPINDLY family)